MFFCLFVCWNKPRKTILRLLLGGKWTPWEWSHTGRGTDRDVHTKDNGTAVRAHVLVDPWLTLYKLTGWLASLDLGKPCTRRILNHRTAAPYAWYSMLGERSTMWCVEIANCPPTQQKLMTETWPTYRIRGELLIHHHHIFNKTGTSSTHNKSQVTSLIKNCGRVRGIVDF